MATGAFSVTGGGAFASRAAAAAELFAAEFIVRSGIVSDEPGPEPLRSISAPPPTITMRPKAAPARTALLGRLKGFFGGPAVLSPLFAPPPVTENAPVAMPTEMPQQNAPQPAPDQALQ